MEHKDIDAEVMRECVSSLKIPVGMISRDDVNQTTSRKKSSTSVTASKIQSIGKFRWLSAVIAALILVFSIAGYLQSNLRSENFSANPAVNNKMIIYFQHNRHTLESQSLKNLNLLAESLFQNPGMEINVKGYSDATGSYDYNLQISRKRANFIKSYLVQIGVNPYVINAHGLGP